MRIVILGAGALGSIFGGYLARAGLDVTLIGRRPHMEAITQHGLHVTGRDDFTVHPGASVDASAVTEADLLLVCVRSTDMVMALQDVSHLRPAIVASFQNSLRKEEMLAEYFGPGPVLGASTVVGAKIVEPGHAHCTLFGQTWFGERDHHVTPRLQGVVSLWHKAGLPVQITTNIQEMKWSKLAYLLAVSALSGLTRLPYHRILQTRDLAYLLVQIVREVNKIARAHGMQLQDYPPINPRLLVERPFEDVIALLAARGALLERSGQTEISTNMLYDISVGRPTEIEDIAGDLVRLAREAGVSAPSISFVYRAIRGIDYWAARN